MTREEQIIARGYAILFIVLHNFCHYHTFNLPQENEMSFSSEKISIFFEHIVNHPEMILFDFFSFIGWCGVPMFAYFSGYGLYKKHFGKAIEITNYLKHSWVKLFLMTLPAMIVFLIFFLVDGDFKAISRRVLGVFFLNNLVSGFGGSFAMSVAPPYWYLGMTLQLYIWFLFIRRMNFKYLLLLIVIPIFIMSFSMNNPVFLRWLRFNSIAWLPVFALGIISAKKSSIEHEKSKALYCITVLVSAFAIVVLNANFHLWLLLPFFAIFMFISMTILTSICRPLYRIMHHVGNLSMYLFLVHPIILKINILTTPPMRLWSVMMYLMITFALAYLYRFVHKLILKYLNI